MTALLQFRDVRLGGTLGPGRAFDDRCWDCCLMAFEAAAAQPPAQPASQPANPRAIELFDRDWVLNQWAKRQFDKNGDGVISVDEAQPAAPRSRRSPTATAMGASRRTNMSVLASSSSRVIDQERVRPAR